MIAMVKRFLADERGLEGVEYAVMTALIVVALITAIGALSTAISGRFNEVRDVVNTIA